MIHSNEQMNADNQSGSSIAKNGAINADASAHGRYSATLVGPREECRAEYLELRDKRQQLIMLGDEAQAEAVAEIMRSMEEEKWTEEFENVVTTVGKNAALDAFLAGSAYTVVGPYLGLINSTASAAAAADTMASHSGWLEVGGANAPAYSGTRKTAGWSSAASGEKQLNTAAVFDMTGSGTVGGCFLVFYTGASPTIDNLGGVLYSAGAFTGGSKGVSPGDKLNVTYKATLNA